MIGRRIRPISRRASASSSALICSKSFACSSSRADQVRYASSSTSGGSSSCSPSPVPGCLGSMRLGDAPAHLLLRLRRLLALQRRQEQMHHPLEQLRVAPEDVEALVEQLALVAPVHEHRVQRPVEILPALEAYGLDRTQRLQHPPRPDRQPRRAQGAGEVHHVAGEPAGAGGGGFHGAATSQ